MVVPVFGVLANLVCMVFYLVGPFTVAGMSKMEPFIALGVARPLGRLRLVVLRQGQQEKGKGILVAKRDAWQRLAGRSLIAGSERRPRRSDEPRAAEAPGLGDFLQCNRSANAAIAPTCRRPTAQISNRRDCGR